MCKLVTTTERAVKGFRAPDALPPDWREHGAGLPGLPHVQPPCLSGRTHRGGKEETLLADSVGIALYVVMDALTPAERVSFVLHDVFEIPFDAIAAILGRSTAAAKMPATRARGRIRSWPIPS
jgi:DNA-directed RNA polymerase specialized sigma24 family protein